MIFVTAMAAVQLAAAPPVVEARIHPPRPIVERTAAGESLSFDILLRNKGGRPVELAELELVFADAGGRPVLTRRVDGNGAAPSIGTLGELTIAPAGERLFFNPFQLLPPGLEAHRVTVRASFEPGEGNDELPPVKASAAVDRRLPAQKLLLPVTGRVWVWDGHDALSHHRRWDFAYPGLRSLGFASNAMRYSYDFVPVDAEGRMSRGDEAANESYFGFGMPVRAPAAGLVTEAVGDRPDDRAFDQEQARTNSNAVFGNYVVIDHGNGSFSMLGHVKQHSVTVRAGERVRAGQAVAAIGASGSSLFPHLHYQLVDGPTMHGEGLPSYFKQLKRLRGAKSEAVAVGHIDSGDIVVAR